jgi:hypothetical protein
MSPRPYKVAAFVDVIVERPVAESNTEALRLAVSGELGCLRVHRVEWQDTRIDPQSGRMTCRFRARDAESVRLALRCGGIDYEALRVADATDP